MVLADTTGLSLEQESADLLLYRRPGVAKLNHYTAFIIEPVEVVYTSRGMMAVSQDEITEIKRYFQRAVIAELREHGYQVVHKPAERVLRVQLKLTGLDPGRPLLNLTGTTASAVTMEVEFRESLSDRLDAVKDMDKVVEPLRSLVQFGSNQMSISLDSVFGGVV